MDHGPRVLPAPATMTQIGQKFLEALAAEAGNGCFTEVGPLFGSSTQAIARGRRTTMPIHTIDTFEPAPWIIRRIGENLSREAFDRYTGHIEGLVVHQGFSPDVVRETWGERIGFFFDDATHGDPGWSDNFNFFSTFFAEDAIVCGDDFAGGWPDIPRNVVRIAAEWGAGLYVIGRVWAITRSGEERIVSAVRRTVPLLARTDIESDHGAGTDLKPAACWSRGLHQRAPLRRFRVRGEYADRISITTYRDDRDPLTSAGTSWVEAEGLNGIEIDGPPELCMQLCVTLPRKTENTRNIRVGERFDLEPGQQIVSVRLGNVPVKGG